MCVKRLDAHAHDDLPLLHATPARWVNSAMADPLSLLNDHAHLERKAASNALELLSRYPDPHPPTKWVEVTTAVARDEVEHLHVVCRLLAKRGGRLTKRHQCAYAAALRKLVRLGQGPDELVDRLLISALIEARSCERFSLLANHCEDKELAKLYRGLCASEAGHYRVFLNLASSVPQARGVEKRWHELLKAEAAIVRQQVPGSTMHSGVE